MAAAGAGGAGSRGGGRRLLVDALAPAMARRVGGGGSWHPLCLGTGVWTLERGFGVSVVSHVALPFLFEWTLILSSVCVFCTVLIFFSDDKNVADAFSNFNYA